MMDLDFLMEISGQNEEIQTEKPDNFDKLCEDNYETREIVYESIYVDNNDEEYDEELPF